MTENTSSETAAPPTTEAPADGRRRILDAALEEFAFNGFSGASIRQIARRAETQHQLLIHHFKNKETLWRAVAGEQLGATAEVYRQVIAAEKAQGAAPALRLLICEFVEWSARTPAFHRMVAFEAQQGSERMAWMIKNYLSVLYEVATRLIARAQEDGLARSGPPHQLYFALFGMVNSRFLNTAAYLALTGRPATARDEIDALQALACDFLGLSR